MKRWLEILVFLSLAVAVHLALFSGAPRSGVTAGGSGSDAMVSIQAAAPTVVEMVEAWERPPDIQTVLKPDVTAPQPPTVTDSALPDLQIEQAPNAQVSVALAAPQLDVTPPPPPKPEPETEKQAKPDVRPKQRPEEKPKPDVQKADVTSAGVAKQVSAGSGGGAQAGSGNAKVTTSAPGQQAKLQAVWGAKIRARIERNKRYPRGARSSGDVTVRLTVSRDGRLMSHQLVSSSGDPKLDQAALNAVGRAKRFPKAPKELTGDSFPFSVRIRLMPRQ